MPPVYVLNHPPHPFWDFVQEMNEHPFFRQTPPPPGNGTDQAEATRSGVEPHQNQDANAGTHDAADPPDVDPATLRAQAREARHEARRQEHEARRQEHDARVRDAHMRARERREAHEARRAQRSFTHHGPWHNFAPPPFTMGGGPGFGPGNQEPNHPFPHGPSFGFGWGGRGRGGRGRRGGPHHDHDGFHGHHRGHRSGPPFNLGNFLNDLGDKIGIDLQGAAEGLGIDRFMPSSASPDVDFEPKVDIFEVAQEFIIHASLPGAKKQDVGADWDGEHSVLRIAGVVHRPDADEEMLQHLVVDGRKREVGVFEKTIRLGTQSEPASIDVAGIRAKMSDGVLVIHVPKAEKEHHKRDVPISSAPPSPPQYEQDTHYEDEDMYDITPQYVQTKHPVLQPQNVAGVRSRTLTPEPIEKALPVRETATQHEQPTIEEEVTITMTEQPQEEKGNSDKLEVVDEKKPAETVPGYFPSSEREMDDWERSDSEEEGDFVKINVE